MSKQPSRHLSTGQAISEFLVVAAVLVPLLLVIASFANLLNVNTTATKAARFYGWEQTVHSTEQGLTNDQINSRVRENIDSLLLEVNTKKWSDFAPGGARTTTNLPSIVDTGRKVEFRNDVVGSPTANFIGVHSTSIARRAGLNEDQLKAPTISIPIDGDTSILKMVDMVSYREANYQQISAPIDEVAGESRFHIDASAPMITNGWVPVDEEAFTSAVEDLSKGGTKVLGFFENPLLLGSSVVSLLGFQEMSSGTGEAGLSTVSTKQTELLPTDLGEFVE